eukprot:GILK01003407.1.p1 GENE.GILK01003407.1~~GILK01003407.1.p1  ORF type:complete len:289 (-),score=47.81 GILK01003407.1:236-1030(-)
MDAYLDLVLPPVDDEDEDTLMQMPEPLKTPALQLTSEGTAAQSDGKLTGKVLLVGLQGAGAGYLLTCLNPVDDLNRLASIDLPDQTRQPSRNVVGDNCCFVYSLKADPAVLVAICQYQVDAEMAYAWSNLLMSSVQVPRVIILDTLLSSSYKLSETYPSAPLLRCLYTQLQQRSNAIPVCPFLECPNIVDGAAAALLSHCELSNIAASLFVSIQTGISPDVDTLEALDKVSVLIAPLRGKASRDKYREVCRKLESKMRPESIYL